MHWYDGSIAEAVNLSKQRNAIFVVFVEGDNDLSVEMLSTIDSPAVLQKLSDQSAFLAVKLKSGSVHYTHFAQLYQFVPVPSLFFIGRNGTPLEVVCAGVAADDLASRVARILDEHRKEPQPPQPLQPSTSGQALQPSTSGQALQPSTSGQALQPSTSGQALRQGTADLIQAEAAPPQTQTPAPEHEAPEVSPPAAKHQKTDDSGQYRVVCDGDTCVRVPVPESAGTAGTSRERIAQSQQQSAPEPSPQESQASIEDKLEKAKQLIEARRREKEEKDKELERQRELERRAAGQGVAELKKWQAEQELRHLQEERKREKLENNLARQRILEQIAQDRAERRARDAAPAQEQVARPADTASDGTGTRTRIQFKLPDGASHTAHFDCDQTLGDVRKYVCDNLELSRSSFSLWTAFPRRELSASEETLRQLNLTPSAALLVLTHRSSAVAPSRHSLNTLLEFLSQLLSSLVLQPAGRAARWVRSALFPANPPPPANPAPGVRRGNVHRLPGERSADDDTNTWNGNSTQQM